MKLGLLAAVVLTGCNACQSTPTASSPSDQAIYDELTDAGCLLRDDSGLAAVHAERALNPPAAWMNCLSNGGTVAGCAVPCSP